MYDFLIVGAGLAGSIFAYEASKKNYKCLVIDKRPHIGGNCYTKEINGIIVHKYGPHIFHTSDNEVWNYINQFTTFNNFINSPKAIYKNKLYSLPFNMNTFYELWGCKTPREAAKKIKKSSKSPRNLEEQAISLVGSKIYKTLIKGYTEKQWGKPCKELPSEIIKRIPVRFTFNNNYFEDTYQGIPKNGYSEIFEKLLKDVDLKLACKYDKTIKANKILYTGPIDEYFEYCYGRLEYRSLLFDSEMLEIDNFQGNAVINYTDKKIPYTRIIEHKHFSPENKSNITIITKEYSITPSYNDDVFYPVNTKKNNKILEFYQQRAEDCKNVIFTGRLGLFKYMDMDKVIKHTLELCKKEL
jgi:UDP-galactopyranose mutase